MRYLLEEFLIVLFYISYVDIVDLQVYKKNCHFQLFILELFYWTLFLHYAGFNVVQWLHRFYKRKNHCFYFIIHCSLLIKKVDGRYPINILIIIIVGFFILFSVARWRHLCSLPPRKVRSWRIRGAMPSILPNSRI